VCDEIEGQHGVTILVIVGVGVCAVNLIPAGNSAVAIVSISMMLCFTYKVN
jgi:hypothetical protein